MHPFFKMYIFEVVTFICCLLFIQSPWFLSGSTYLKDSCFWWSIFPLNYQKGYSHQTSQGSNILERAPTHEFACYFSWVVLWGHMKEHICKPNYFSKRDQIRSFLRIWSYSLKKSVMENFIFCAVLRTISRVLGGNKFNDFCINIFYFFGF